ncbi:MAG: tetratricopeptide repeat protein [Archangiaceae bacterium]|nr:tetratricopeptide repeat protein [Archangiaceae bacterium]
MRWLAVGALIVVLALVLGRKRQGEVRVPTDPSEVLEHVASSSSSGRELKALEAAARAEPKSLERAVAAARKALELAQRENDPRYPGRAQAALARWWALEQPPPEVVQLRAKVRLAQHDFEGARSDLLQLEDPGPALAALELRTGRYPQARAACGADPVCHARVDSLTGRAREAKAALAASSSLEGLVALGEVSERAGDDAGAEAAYRAALKLAPENAAVMNALADLLLATQRPGEVEPLLGARFSNDAALLRLAIAERMKAGKPGAYAQMLRWRSAEVSRPREQARFALEVEGDAERALELAAKSWALQKEPVDSRVLLEAALAAKRPAQARAAAQWVLDSGATEPRLIALARAVLASAP